MIRHFKILNRKLSPDGVFAKDFIVDFARKHQLEITRSLEDITEEQGVFEYNENGLFLHLLLDGSLANLHLDLNEGRVGYRAKSVSKNNELIARAIGIKSHYRPKVLDATAGMGRDALIMAKLGCPVIMQERCFPIYLLLENALDRLFQNQLKLTNLLTLHKVDSINALTKEESIDVIYLDPMFPARKKSALVKKEMRLFKKLAGDDLDADQLLKSALQAQVKRVVVKRPKNAPQLLELNPNFEIKSKNFRFDVYLN